MNRKYTTEKYKSLIKEFREICPDYSLTTDWIVGFCSESREDFEKSLDFYREMDFDMVFHSKYSERPNTYATENLDDNVPKKEKEIRWQELDKLMKEIAWRKNKEMIGKEVKILIEKVENNLSYGHTSENKIAIIDGNKTPNEFYIGTVYDTNQWQLLVK